MDPHSSSHGAPPRKRRRLVVSCIECHRRKQKCNRQIPCSNCVARAKTEICYYQGVSVTHKDNDRPQNHNNNSSSSSNDDDDGNSSSTRTPASSSSQAPDFEPRDIISAVSAAAGALIPAAVDLGYSHGPSSTLNLLRQLESRGGNPDVEAGASREPSLSCAAQTWALEDSFLPSTRTRYKDLIRQLPTRDFVEPLVDAYFEHFNWQYYPLDRDIFDDQLRAWYDVPFGVISARGPAALEPDLMAFPALLFQVLAMALLDQNDKGKSSSSAKTNKPFEALKYAGGMSFIDLAIDYSQSGMALLGLLGKTRLTLVTVQAGFLRATLLKYMARVVEAWHMIGSTIRDAREIGMHTDSLDPEPIGSDMRSKLENMWLIERRRRLYRILSVWDLHCSVVLGRLGAIDPLAALPSMPVDAPLPPTTAIRYSTPVRARNPDRDPPTPLTRAIWGSKLLEPLRDILALEVEGTSPRTWSRLDRVHRTCVENDQSLPPYFRHDNPDTRWDALPECRGWLPATRHYLPALPHFCLMALHRPHVFGREESRSVALRAGILTLKRQLGAFQQLATGSWKNYTLFYGTFDAVVLIVSLRIMFPQENPDVADDSLLYYRWLMQRFEAMKERSPLAKAAGGILKLLDEKLQTAGERHKNMSKSGMPALSIHSERPEHAQSHLSMQAPLTIISITPASVPNAGNEHDLADAVYSAAAASEGTQNDLGLVPSVWPLRDLLFGDLGSGTAGVDWEVPIEWDPSWFDV